MGAVAAAAAAAKRVIVITVPTAIMMPRADYLLPVYQTRNEVRATKNASRVCLRRLETSVAAQLCFHTCHREQSIHTADATPKRDSGRLDRREIYEITFSASVNAPFRRFYLVLQALRKWVGGGEHPNMVLLDYDALSRARGAPRGLENSDWHYQCLFSFKVHRAPLLPCRFTSRDMAVGSAHVLGIQARTLLHSTVNTSVMS